VEGPRASLDLLLEKGGGNVICNEEGGVSKLRPVVVAIITSS